MKYITHYLLPNEPCIGLHERPEGERWVQHCWVVRDDTIADHITDIGPADSFPKATPFALHHPSEDVTVQEAQAEAVKMRNDTYGYDLMMRYKAESTLIPDLIRQNEQIHEILQNRSHLGPGGLYQRNGFSRETSQRQIMDRKRERSGKWFLK